MARAPGSWVAPRALRALLCLAFAAPVPAWAGGPHTQIFVALKAIDHVQPGPLRTFLDRADVRDALLCGALLPDGAAALGRAHADAEGSDALVRALAKRMRTRWPKPSLDPEGARTLAFVLGLQSHGIADEVFVGFFLWAAARFDKKGWSTVPEHSPTAAADAMLIGIRGPSPVPGAWLPAVDLAAAHADLGLDVSAAALEADLDAARGTGLGAAANRGADPGVRAQATARYPWIAGHLFDPFTAGGPQMQARVVAASWQATWDEIALGKPDPHHAVLAVVPSDGGAGHPVARDDAAGVLGVVLARAVRSQDVGSGAVVVRDDLARTWAMTVEPAPAPRVGRTLRFVPSADAQVGRTFIANLKAGLRFEDGARLDLPVSWSFRSGHGARKEPGDPPPLWEGASPVFLDQPEGHAVEPGCAARPAVRAGARSSWATLLLLALGSVCALWRWRSGLGRFAGP
ncbi:MAG: hypothetical protein EXR79_06460 [Myxococcales bacterium]|nr:hypothetical protein [Myxococcales bacterium]